jgi:alpha-beta hydrolase superfamily lysophospholipase
VHFILTCLSLWLAANLIHTAWVSVRRLLWERRIVRDADGLLPDAAAFTVGNGPIALLFVHGFADTPRVWKRFAERLAATGLFTCRALRLPGCAEPAERARRQSLARWQAAVDDEIDRLRAAHTHLWLVGHSLGGALSIDAALRRPGIVHGLVLLAPLINVSRKRSPLLPPALWFKLATVALACSPTFESCFSANGVAADDPSFTYTRDRFIPFGVYRALFALVRINRDRASTLSLPVFAELSGRDKVVDTPAAQVWLAGCRGETHVRVAADIGHVVPIELGWQTLADDVAAFIQKRTPLCSQSPDIVA